MMNALDDKMTRRVAVAAGQRLLSSAGACWIFSMVLFVGALTLFWVPVGGSPAGSRSIAALLAVSSTAGLVALYSGFRVRLDAMLFAMLDLPDKVGADEFAAGIDRFRKELANHGHAVGDPVLRMAGAMRWWRIFVAALSMQVMFLVAATAVAGLGSTCYLSVQP